MRILIAVVHYWNPEGGGRHQSLRPDPTPRVEALQALILALKRLSRSQYFLNIKKLNAEACNECLNHIIDLYVVTDGYHHVVDHLSDEYHGTFTFVSSAPRSSRHLGFEAHRLIAQQMGSGRYDLVGYMEDDLVIQDPLFFNKIHAFQAEFGPECVLLPQRIELINSPHYVDRFYIDGPLPERDLSYIIPNPAMQLCWTTIGGDVIFESPLNPHSGCFFLTECQMRLWLSSPSWEDGDDSWISPLESAATLGIAKIFHLYKPSLNFASWLELQHWGTSFHSNLRPNHSEFNANNVSK